MQKEGLEIWATKRTGPTIATALRCLSPNGNCQVKLMENQDREVVRIKETLRCQLTAPEKAGLSEIMTQAIMEKEDAEESLKAVKAQFKSEIAAKEASIKTCAQKLNAGFEMRQVDCHLIRDYRDSTIRVIRLDTGKQVSERTMTIDERQRGLGL